MNINELKTWLTDTVELELITKDHLYTFGLTSPLNMANLLWRISVQQMDDLVVCFCTVSGMDIEIPVTVIKKNVTDLTMLESWETGLIETLEQSVIK